MEKGSSSQISSSPSPIIFLNKFAIYFNCMHVMLMNDEMKTKYKFSFCNLFLKKKLNSDKYILNYVQLSKF